MTATDELDLRSGDPLWEHYSAPRVPHQRLTRDTAADVLIVGAGITGAMIGEALSDAGLQVVIVDRRPPTKGSTTASTALVQYEIDTPLRELTGKIGKADAMRAWRRSRLAVTSLSGHLQTLGIESQRRNALYLAGNELNPAQLQDEREARLETGLLTRYLTARELKSEFGIARKGALLGYDNIAVNPRAMTAVFLKAAAANGAIIYSPARVSDVEPMKSGVTTHFDNGRSIRANTLVFATGYEIPKGVPRKGHKISSTWAIATKRQTKALWPTQCMIWEASDPYLYLRTSADGRVICGGEDEEFSDEVMRDEMMEKKVAALVRKLGKLLPKIDPTPQFRWCAAFGESDTGLPSIGRVPGMRNCWAAMGYGGNGITYSRIAAEIIRTALTGGHDPDADLYAFR